MHIYFFYFLAIHFVLSVQFLTWLRVRMAFKPEPACFNLHENAIQVGVFLLCSVYENRTNSLLAKGSFLSFRPILAKKQFFFNSFLICHLSTFLLGLK